MPAAVEKPLTELQLQPYKNDQENECDEIFKSQEEMARALSRFCYGDLYLIGKIWISVVKAILVGAKLSLIPTVSAEVRAASVIEKGPEKPKKMKASDLPLYECPHATYKDYLEEKTRCPQIKKKIIHSMVQPHVKKCRQVVQKIVCSTKCQVLHKYYELRCNALKTREQFMFYMRDPLNLDIRRGVVAVGAGLGYVGSGRGIPKKIFWTGFGAATAGMLCFPKETDQYIQTFCYYTGKVLISSYNSACYKNATMDEVLCSKDLPNIPPEVRPNKQCPKKP